MMRCIIIEDQPPAQRVLKKYILDLGNISLAGTFPDALQAMEFLRSEAVDLIFLDIHLPKLSGIDFLKALDQKPNVILTTAFSDYALESYEYHVVDYLLKPFSFERFVQAVSKVRLPNPNPGAAAQGSKIGVLTDVIFIKSGYEHIKININDILYIQSDADYTEVYTDEKKYLSHEPLRYWEETLNSALFMRTHKSYILNITKIEKIVGNQVRLNPQISIPIGRAYKDHFIKQVLK